MLNLLLGAGLIYGAFLVLLYFKQRTLVFQPTHNEIKLESNSTKDGLAIPSKSAWPENSNYRGYLAEPESAEANIVVFHGNYGQASDRQYYIDILVPLGYRVFLLEYPGYGQRPGQPSEKHFVQDGRKSLQLIAETYPEEPIHLLGESLGSGVASAVVSENWATSAGIKIKSVILITPFESLAAVAQSRYWFAPVKWLVKDRFDSLKNLQMFDEFKTVVIAGEDATVPAQHGERLYRGLPAPKNRLILESAGHNNWLEYTDQHWWLSLFAEISRASDSGTSTEHGN